MRSDLIDENWWVIAHYYMPVAGGREDRIDEFQADKVGAHLRLLVDALFSEVGGVAVSGDGEGGEVLEDISGRDWRECRYGGECTCSSKSEPFCLQTTPRICAVASFLMTSRTVVSAIVTLHHPDRQREFPSAGHPRDRIHTLWCFPRRLPQLHNELSVMERPSLWRLPVQALGVPNCDPLAMEDTFVAKYFDCVDILQTIYNPRK